MRQTRTDDLGRKLTLTGTARRIVSLSPATTENLFAIGAGRSLVGVTSACDFPAEAKNLPRVGDFTRPSYEKILSLKPDLIVFDSATVNKSDVESFAARVRVPVFVQRSLKVADVPRHLEELGMLVTTKDNRSAAFVADRIRRALLVSKPISAVPVFVEISAVPLYAVGPGSFVDDLVRLAGGQNVVTEGGPFPQLTKEKLLTLKPQVYVIATTPGVAAPAPNLPDIRVVRVPADLLFRPTPRLVTGLRLLVTAFRTGGVPGLGA